MPVYLVRWPNLDLALVQAKNEAALIDILDEVDDPSSASWSVFKGPFYLGLKSPVTVHMDPQSEDGSPLGDRQVSLEGLEEVLDMGWQFQLEEDFSEAAGETTLRMLERALPHVAQALLQLDLSPEELGEAVLKELEPLFAYRWRAAQLDQEDDPRVALLRQLGLTEFTPALIEVFQQAAAREGLELEFEPTRPAQEGGGRVLTLPDPTERASRAGRNRPKR